MIFTAALGGYWGSCTCAVLGCWLALELRGYHLAGYTAGMLFALLTVASIILAIVLTAGETMWSGHFAVTVLARGLALVVDAAD